MDRSTVDSNKRENIIRAAVKVFSQKGFHEAKVDEIAQLADVGKGTVYEYFSSKTELFQEMFKAGNQFYMDGLKKELKPEMTCREKLLKIFRLHLSFILKYKDLARVTMAEHPHFKDDFRAWMAENRIKKIELLKQIIDEGIAKGEFRKVDSYAASLAFIGTLGALLPSIIFSDEKLSHERLLDPILDLFFNGISNGQE